MTHRIDKDGFDRILAAHTKWFRHIPGGRRADLRGVNLQGIDLYHVDLRGADLRGADLRGVVLQHTDLRGADLRGAHLDMSFVDCDAFLFWDVQFTPDALPWLILHPDWPELQDRVNIKEED